MLHALVTANAPVEPDPTLVTPGLLGLVMVLALGAALFLLVRSMSKQLRRIDVPTEAEVAEAGGVTEDEIVLPGASASDDKKS